MCDIDLEPCEVFEETERRASKEHVCSCCGGLIRAGERYWKHFSVFDGTATSEKMCATCRRVAERFRKDHGTRCNPSGMQELLGMCVDEEYLENPLVALKWMRDLKRMQRRRQKRIAAQEESRP